MDSDSWRSPLGSESQDEFGSGLWMDTDNGSVEEREGGDPLAPRVEEEDAAALSPELQQTSLSRDFPSPPPPSTEGEEMMESNRGSGDQEWPPEPGQADKPEPINKDQLSESPEGSDSIVFLSEDGEEQGIDCKPLDFTSAREQWVRRDSNSSKPPTPAFSRSSSQDRITEEHHNVPLSHQGEPEEQNPAPNTENREVQQVCTPAPPLEMVAGEQGANPQSPAYSPVVMKEPLTEAAGGWREGGRESEQTDRERKQTVSGSEERSRESEAEDVKESEELTSTDAPTSQGSNRMDLDQFEDSQSDSGVSADFSPNSTSENTTSVAVSSQDPSETPIEREIRLAIKREQSLRRSRGLGTAENKAEEFVEIPVRKSVLSQDLPIKSMKNEGKDRQFAGKKMQREIREETEREKVLVQLGRLPGFYDKGTVKQLKEKKLLFEAFQEVKEDCAFLQNKRPSLFFPFDLSNGGTQAEEAAGSLKKHMGSLESPAQDPNDNHNCPTVTRFSLASTGPRGPGLTESSKGEVIILENTFSPVAHSPGLERKSETVVDGSGTGRHFSVKPYSVEQLRNQEKGDNSSDNDEDSVKDNPFFKLRSSLSLRPDVEQEIREAREREKELRKQRTRLYGWGSEVEGARSSANPTSTHSNPNTVKLPAKTSITITTPSVRQSLGKLDLTWPPPPPEDLRTQSELQKSPKRQRSVLLQRWENGLVNGQQE